MRKQFTAVLPIVFVLTNVFAEELVTQTTPAQRAIQSAEAQIAGQPDHAAFYNNLALAYVRRGRETSDSSYYLKAEETLKRSFDLTPKNYDAEKIQVAIQLGQHEFQKALESAKVLNKQVPDDVAVYGYLAEANQELGNYAAAVDATQWMLKLRAGDLSGLIHAAHLRELHGDVPGSLDLLQMAYDATAFQEVEERMRLLTQMAHLHLLSGNVARAEQYAQGALDLVPNDPFALDAVAQVRAAQKRFDEAIALERKRNDVVPGAESLYALAEMLRKAGHEDANTVYAEFVRAAQNQSTRPDNVNHELVTFYADVAHQPQKALDVAKLELARRHDIYTLDAYAWALASNREYAEAQKMSEQALATNTKDPNILEHARVIAQEARQ